MNDEFSRALRPVKARLRRNRFLRGLAFGLLAGLAAALAVRILSLWIPMERKWLWALLPVPACALLCALFGALRPVRASAAAEAADAAGLRERTVTALENAEKDTEICRLQRADACAALRSLDVKRIRPASVKKVLLASLGCFALLAALLFIRVPADSAAEARAALRQTLREGSEQVAKAAEKDGESLTREERAELRRLAEDLERDLSGSRDEADALVALDRAEQRLEQLRAQTAGEAASASVSQAGGSGPGEGNSPGSGENPQSDGQSSANGQNTNGTSGSAVGKAPNTASALSSLKSAVNPSQAKTSGQSANGNSGKAGKSGQTGKSGNSGNSGNSGTASGQSGQSGSQGSGQGAGGAGGQGKQSGGGAGEGSTNLEQEGGGNGSGTHASGSRDPRYKEEQYETIYDPERAEAAFRDEATNQNRLGDDGSVQIETGPGKGRLGGDVPWGSVLGEYAETETRSAERENLTGQERQWVEEYYRLLTEQNN